MSIGITLKGQNEIKILYASVGHVSGKEVTAYLIFPDFIKSDVYIATEIGDGVYGFTIPYDKKTNGLFEKYGIVVKENGIVKQFEILYLVN